jgi:hypothetical protein
MLRHRTLTILTTLLCVFGTTGALMAGAASARPQPGRAHATATHVAHVRPVSKTGRLRSGYTIDHRRGHAHCVLGSEATGTAYRCFAGNEVLDPCWVQAGSAHSHVICLGLPWSHNVSRLHVTKGYDNSAMTTPAREPWGVRLTNGTRCGRVQGASGSVHGRFITYFCQSSKTVLTGEPNRSQQLWRIHTARSTPHGHFKRTGRKAISKAFFGRPSLVG